MKGNYLTLKNRALTIHKMIVEKKKPKYPVPYLNDIYEELEIIYSIFINKFLSKDDISNSNLYFINSFIDVTNNDILSLLQNASNIKEPKAITIPIREKIKQNDEDALYIPELIWEVNYYIGEVSERYNKFIASLGMDCRLSKKIYRFGIPYFYQNNVLMSGIIGHELGHYFDLFGGLDITEKLLVDFTNDDTFVSKMIPFVVSTNGIIKDTDIPLRKIVVKTFLSRKNIYFKNWIEEFVADSLGIILYGICSIFASENLIQTASINEEQVVDIASLTHPRNQLRDNVKQSTLRYMRYDLTKLPSVFQNELAINEKKWSEAKTEYQQEIIELGELCQNHAFGFEVNKDSISLMEEYLTSNFNKIIEQCEASLSSSLAYKPDNMESSLIELSNKIGDLLPPNDFENGAPSDSISIINAAWLAYLTPSELLKTQYSDDDKLLDCINSLSGRALEVSSIHRRWLNDTTT